MTFLDPALGKAIPYGVYDLANNEGWVSVGIDHDTAEFAANAIRQWWTRMGRHRFPRARRLLITADAGGSNGARSRLWKWALQRVADDFDLTLSICHFPPGTANGTKSNIASSASSRRTGAGNLWSVTKRSSTSWPPRPLGPAYA